MKKKLGDYHNLYVQSHTLLLADLSEKFRNMCLKIYELDPDKFLSAPAISWPASLKRIKVKLDLLTNISVLLILEKGIRGGICHYIYRNGKANSKHVEDYDKSKESSYLQGWDVSNSYGSAMLEKLSLNNFQGIKDTSKFNEDFIKLLNLMKILLKTTRKEVIRVFS